MFAFLIANLDCICNAVLLSNGVLEVMYRIKNSLVK